ncbi:hypothetical protein FACS1894167_12670 [Synergistales bacterium]|nr:hypothetical protein FACS1894167_12670 [Synergistales bacterium]
MPDNFMNVHELLSISTAKKFASGSVLIKEDDKIAKDMYIILKGSVGVFKNYGTKEQVQLATVGAGDTVGEMSLFLNEGRTASVIATEEIVALQLSPGNVFEFFKTQPKAVLGMFKLVCSRLQKANASHTQPAPAASPIASAAKILPVQGTPPAVASPPAKAAAPLVQVSSPLLPEGHGAYDLHLEEQDKSLLYLREITCPMCEKTFKALATRTTKLVKEKDDLDLRSYFKGIEPMYYSIAVCPHCWFSAPAALFAKGNGNKYKEVQELMVPYKSELPMKFGEELDSFSVFASHYMGIACAPIAYRKEHYGIVASLWLNLSRMYGDCGDAKMTDFASQKALESYQDVFTKADISGDQAGRVSFILGDLFAKLGDYAQSRKYFYDVKRNRDCGGLLRNFADIRLDDLKKIAPPGEGEAEA